ncbi:MAG: RDD family protein [Vicinamibacteria bacterium]
MMQCPSCSAPLVSSEARCVSCHALVNPHAQGTSALAPRLVTPQSIEGVGAPQDPLVIPEGELLAPGSAPRGSEAKVSDDDAWRREVLERVRKRRQVRSRALPLFVEGQAPSTPPADVAAEPVDPIGSSSTASPHRAAYREADPFDEIVEELPDVLENVAPLPPTAAPDLLASLDVPLGNDPDDRMRDLPLRPSEPLAPAPVARIRGVEVPSQSLVERARPTLVAGPASPRSLVADLPLVEPSRLEAMAPEASSRPVPTAVSSRAASMNDRMQAALIDVGMWSAMSVTAFYFASRIARTSILGLGPAWHGLALFSVVLGASYILFFGGLSGATPGKIACGIQVRRYDGSSLGPLPSLARGVLGIFGIALLGVGIWPAFWDRDRRGLHDRATDSRVTIV